MVQIYLRYPGTCEEAMQFYQQALGGQIGKILRYSDLPSEAGMPVDAASGKLVMHAEMDIRGTTLLFCDAPEEVRVGDHFAAVVSLGSEEAVDRACALLSEGGRVTYAPTATPFNPMYATLTDRFGVCWVLLV